MFVEVEFVATEGVIFYYHATQHFAGQSLKTPFFLFFQLHT